jgi:aminopeptidase N
VAVDIARDPQFRGIKPISFDVTDVKITSVDVQNAEGTRDKISYDSYYGNDNTSFHVLLTDTVGHINNFTVFLGFESQLTDTLQGFYRGSYEDEQGKKSLFASTQFSPIDARRAFPCFDRPDKKASFEVSVVHKHDQQTFLSNMPHSFSS